MLNLAQPAEEVKVSELDDLSPAQMKKLQVIIAAMILGFVSAEAVSAAAAGPGPDAIIENMEYRQYRACLEYWVASSLLSG